MNFNEAMQMLGTKLQGKYGHLGFKYKKSDKTLTRHSKNFTYCRCGYAHPGGCRR